MHWVWPTPSRSDHKDSYFLVGDPYQSINMFWAPSSHGHAPFTSPLSGASGYELYV